MWSNHHKIGHQVLRLSLWKVATLGRTIRIVGLVEFGHFDADEISTNMHQGKRWQTDRNIINLNHPLKPYVTMDAVNTGHRNMIFFWRWLSLSQCSKSLSKPDRTCLMGRAGNGV